MENYLAQKITNPALGAIKDKSGIDYVSSLVTNLIGLAFVIGALVFFFILMIGAIQWIVSGGDKAAIEGARGKIINAIIGLVILFATFAVVKIIQDFFGINILALDIMGLKL